MASVQPSIIDLDDLLIQIDRAVVSGVGTVLTIDTIAPHGVTFAAGMKVAISGTNYDGEFPLTAVTDTDTLVLDVTGAGFSDGTQGAIDGTSIGNAFINDVTNNNTYFTPEITLNISTSKFTLNLAGNLSVDGTGVTGQALYSFFKERWKNVPSITKYLFPMLSITNEQFEFINGWAPSDNPTRKRIRSAGWSEVRADQTVSARYAGIVTLGTLGLTDQPYYIQQDSFSAQSFPTSLTGPVNEAVSIYQNVIGTNDINFDSTSSIASTTTDLSVFQVGDSVTFSGTAGGTNDVTVTVTAVTSTSLTFAETTLTASGVDSGSVSITTDRSGTFAIYVRERGKVYADANLIDIGVTTMTYIVYRFPVSNANDLNINTTSDNALAGAAIASITSDGTTWTVNTSVAHGLYAGAPVTLSGTTGGTYDGTFVVAGITDTDTFTITNTNNLTDQAGAAGTSKLGGVDNITINYLTNPATGSGDVVIRGDYADAFAYTQGDVVFDVGNSLSNASGARWYYANSSRTSSGATLALDGGLTNWTLWVDSAQVDGERNIEEDTAGGNGTFSAYSIVIEANNDLGSPGATKEVIYEYTQYLLRLNSDINNITVSSDRVGRIADTLTFFVGSTLNTYNDTSIPSAVVIDDISAADVNNVQYNEAILVTGRTTTARFAPIVVLVTINFNSNLSGDVGGTNQAVFYAYYKEGEGAQAGNDFGTSGAILVKESNGNDVGGTVQGDMTGPNDVPSGGTYTFNYAYDGDTTNGRTGGNPVTITVVAIGLATGQYVSAEGIITAAPTTISLVAPLERNYTNPA